MSGAPISPLSNAHCAQDKSESATTIALDVAALAGWLNATFDHVGCRQLCMHTKTYVKIDGDCVAAKAQRFGGTMMTSYIIFPLFRSLHDGRELEKNENKNGRRATVLMLMTTTTTTTKRQQQ